MIDLTSANLGAYIELYDIDYSTITGNPTDIVRIAPSTNYDDVTGLTTTWVFGGQSYLPTPCKFSGFNEGTSGAPATPTFTLSNLDKRLWGLVMTYDGLVGAKFTRHRTFAKYTIQEGNNTDEEMAPHIFVVSQITKLDRKELTFKLTSPIDQEGSKLPFRQILKDGDFPGVSRRQTR